MKLKTGQVYEVRPGEWLHYDIPCSGTLKGGDKFVVLSMYKETYAEPKLAESHYFILSDGLVKRIRALKDLDFIVGIHIP